MLKNWLVSTASDGNKPKKNHLSGGQLDDESISGGAGCLILISGDDNENNLECQEEWTLVI